MGAVYLVLAAWIFVQQRSYLKPLVRDGLVVPVDELFHEESDRRGKIVSVNSPETPVDEGPLVRWPAVLRGALLGLCVLVGASVIDAILDRNLDSFNDSGWRYPLFVLVLIGYGLGGWLAGRLAPDAFLTNGALAGVGAFVLWIPVRIVIWLVRDEHRGLFTRAQPGAAAGPAVRAPGDRRRARHARRGSLGSRSAARVRRNAS